MIYLFYAVTLTSVYEVKAQDGEFRYPSATKIALRGESELKIGEKLEKSAMISIGAQLTGFIPEGGGLTSQFVGFERRIENVNTFYHGGHTSSVVALFKSKKSALRCFDSEDLEPYDLRWKRATKGVIAAIGENHPSFSVTYRGSLGVPREFAPARA